MYIPNINRHNGENHEMRVRGSRVIWKHLIYSFAVSVSRHRNSHHCFCQVVESRNANPPCDASPSPVSLFKPRPYMFHTAFTNCLSNTTSPL